MGPDARSINAQDPMALCSLQYIFFMRLRAAAAVPLLEHKLDNSVKHRVCSTSRHTVINPSSIEYVEQADKL